jgi:multidrug efflux system membrane fusion protein
LENSLKEIRGGLSAVLTIELEEVIAHLIPSSSVLLDDNGELIVRTVDDNNSVLSFGVSILGETDHGIWVFGLPQIPNVITVGQNYVVDTEKVSPVFLDSYDN